MGELLSGQLSTTAGRPGRPLLGDRRRPERLDLACRDEWAVARRYMSEESLKKALLRAIEINGEGKEMERPAIPEAV